jgi:hypothetical protein
MGASDDKPETPAGPDQEQAERDHATAVTQSRLTEPLGGGEPVDFDPTEHEAPMSDEEFEKLMNKTDESSGRKE